MILKIRKTVAALTIAGSFLIQVNPASALCFFRCDENLQRTAYTAIQPSEGIQQSKIITYTVKDITKTKSSNKIKPNDDSLLEKIRSGMANLGSLQEFEAQIITLVHLGADLKTLKLDDIKVDGKNINISLPKIEVIATELDTKNSILISKKEGVFVSNEATAAFLQNMFEQHKINISHSAINNNDNVKKTKEGLEDTLKRLITKKLGNDYEISFSF
ncbi:MAG: DUF4230 domain-containing protein [Rhodospirillales bacterium]|nr:DUF4230 domain-containing protein [Rhodospirillales bacterium]